jgi:hypothetical protein
VVWVLRRDIVKVFAERLMAAEVHAPCGTGYGETPRPDQQPK